MNKRALPPAVNHEWRHLRLKCRKKHSGIASVHRRGRDQHRRRARSDFLRPLHARVCGRTHYSEHARAPAISSTSHTLSRVGAALSTLSTWIGALRLSPRKTRGSRPSAAEVAATVPRCLFDDAGRPCGIQPPRQPSSRAVTESHRPGPSPAATWHPRPPLRRDRRHGSRSSPLPRDRQT